MLPHSLANDLHYTAGSPPCREWRGSLIVRLMSLRKLKLNLCVLALHVCQKTKHTYKCMCNLLFFHSLSLSLSATPPITSLTLACAQTCAASHCILHIRPSARSVRRPATDVCGIGWPSDGGGCLNCSTFNVRVDLNV